MHRLNWKKHVITQPDSRTSLGFACRSARRWRGVNIGSAFTYLHNKRPESHWRLRAVRFVLHSCLGQSRRVRCYAHTLRCPMGTSTGGTACSAWVCPPPWCMRVGLPIGFCAERRGIMLSARGVVGGRGTFNMTHAPLDITIGRFRGTVDGIN